MEIKNIEDLKTVLNLLAEGKAYYAETIYEGVIELRYNQKKGYIEEYMYQGNPYGGETKEQTVQKTMEELLDTYTTRPELWRNFGIY